MIVFIYFSLQFDDILDPMNMYDTQIPDLLRYVFDSDLHKIEVVINGLLNLFILVDGVLDPNIKSIIVRDYVYIFYLSISECLSH